MKTSVIVSGNEESLQEILLQIKLSHPRLKFPIPPTKSLEKKFGKKEAGVIRRGATARGAVDHKIFGDDY